MCSVRWTSRHDRVDILEEANQYTARARYHNPNCKFFGIVAEMNPARLAKVLQETAPARAHAALERLVHLHAPLATTVINHDGKLQHLWSLSDWIRDSFNWK
jgi:hypothetical protein